MLSELLLVSFAYSNGQISLRDYGMDRSHSHHVAVAGIPNEPSGSSGHMREFSPQPRSDRLHRRRSPTIYICPLVRIKLCIHDVPILSMAMAGQFV